MPASAQRRYAAFLRGVSPMNCKMPALKRCFEAQGYTGVNTVLSSGNVVFDARAPSEHALERKVEQAIEKGLGRAFGTFIRSIDALRALLEFDPFRQFPPRAGAKRVVTFLREVPEGPHTLPIERDGARILSIQAREVFTDYVPHPKGPVFMSLLEKTFGKETTTRTWDTLRKVVER